MDRNRHSSTMPNAGVEGKEGWNGTELKAGLAAWAMEGEEHATDDELVERLATVAVEATAKGGDGTRASLMVTNLSRLITDLPHREGRNRVEAYLDCVHIDIASACEANQ